MELALQWIHSNSQALVSSKNKRFGVYIYVSFKTYLSKVIHTYKDNKSLIQKNLPVWLFFGEIVLILSYICLTMDFMDILLGFILGVLFTFAISQILPNRGERVISEKTADALKAASSERINETMRQNSLLTESNFKSISRETVALLDTKKAEFETALSPLKAQMDAYNRLINELENKRSADYGGIRSFLDTVKTITEDLQNETRNLHNLLSNSQSRGKWGEITLRRIVESAGMLEHVDFDEQVVIGSGDRPDMIIHLPGDKDVIVDSKVPYSNFERAYNSTNMEEADSLLIEFAGDVKKQIKYLSARDYQKNLKSSPDFVIMFMPHENILSTVLSVDPEIVDLAMQKGIILCTPLTLLATLKVIHQSWRQESIVKNSGEILNIASQLYERLNGLFKRFESMGRNVESLVHDYNGILSFTESRVIPSIKKMNQLGEFKTDGDIELRGIDESLRTVNREKWE